MKCVPFVVTVSIILCEMLFLTCTEHTQPCCQSMKLWIMIISIRIKILNKFGASEMMCVELRAKNL